MSHNNTRPIDAPWYFAFIPHYGFGIMLGTKIGVIQTLCLFEHVLAKNTGVKTGSSNRTHMVKSFCLDAHGKLHNIPGALHVDMYLAFSIRL